MSPSTRAIGTVLVLYDAQTIGSRQILRWVDIVVDTGLEIAKEIKPEEADEKRWSDCAPAADPQASAS